MLFKKYGFLAVVAVCFVFSDVVSAQGTGAGVNTQPAAANSAAQNPRGGNEARFGGQNPNGDRRGGSFSGNSPHGYNSSGNLPQNNNLPNNPSPNNTPPNNTQLNNTPTDNNFAGENPSFNNPAADNTLRLQDTANTQPTLPPNGTPLMTNPQNSADSETTSAANEKRNSENLYLISVQDDQSHPIYSLIALERPQDSLVRGKKTYLYEILSSVPASGRQELAAAYWKLSEKLLLCHARLGQKHRITVSKQYYQNNPSLLKELELAEQLTDRQCKALELEFIQAQYQFVNLLKKYSIYRYSNTPTLASSATTATYRSERPTENNSSSQSPNTPLPIPADFPLAVPYNTKIKELEKHRSLSQKTILLDRTIPLQYQSIVVRADARKCAENKMLDDLTSQRSIVASIETLTNEEIGLIKAIIEYNNQVDNYVIETYGTNISSRQFLASILQLPKRPPQQNAPQTLTTSQNLQ